MNISNNWTNAQKNLEQRALSTLKPEVAERYETKHDTQELSSKLDDFSQSRGVELQHRPEELQRMTLGGRGMEKMKNHISSAVDKLLDDDVDRRDVKNFVGRYTDNLKTAYHEATGEHLNAGDAYGLVLKNVVKLALQEQAATETLLGHHGIEHIVTHNMRVAQSIFDCLQQQGYSVSAKDRLLVDQAMVDHDIGYALIADEVRSQGLKGQDAGHAVIGAKLVRESRGTSLLNTFLDDSDWSAYHQAILYHGAPNSEHQSFCPNNRNHNIEMAVRVADTSHGLDEHKLPPLILDHPNALGTLRLMQAADELGRDDLVTKARENLAEDIVNRDDLSQTKTLAFLSAAQQLVPKSLKFMVGRFEAASGQSEQMQDGRLTLVNQENPIGAKVFDFYGLPQEDKQLSKLRSETGADKLPELSVEKVDGPKQPVSNFQGEVANLLRNTPFAGFHRIDQILKASGDEKAREAHLEQFLARQEPPQREARHLAS